MLKENPTYVNELRKNQTAFTPLFEPEKYGLTPPRFIENASENRGIVYHSLNKKMLEKQQNDVLEAFRQLFPASDNDVSRFLDIPEGRVSARRNKLIEFGLIIKNKDEKGLPIKKFDPCTKKKVQTWKAVKINN